MGNIMYLFIWNNNNLNTVFDEIFFVIIVTNMIRLMNI